jgi:Spy/CpxP family protein refolding chaperone
MTLLSYVVRRLDMRARLVALFGAAVLLGACDHPVPVSPGSSSSDVIDLVPDYAVSPAASIDAAGIGGSLLPDSLKLTVEQKAAIAALHDAFMKANAADLAALAAIEQEAKAAAKAGKPRADVRAILAKGASIRLRLDAAFRKLQSDIWAVYTPSQRAWIEQHRPRNCGRGTLQLTDDQVKQIRDLEQKFYASVKADLDFIRAVAQEAREARGAGKSRDEIAAILARATDAQRRVSNAERTLQDAVLAVLTPEQRQAWICRRG